MKLETKIILHSVIACVWLAWAVVFFGIWMKSVAAAFFLFGAIQVATLLKRE